MIWYETKIHWIKVEVALLNFITQYEENNTALLLKLKQLKFKKLCHGNWESKLLTKAQRTSFKLKAEVNVK